MTCPYLKTPPEAYADPAITADRLIAAGYRYAKPDKLLDNHDADFFKMVETPTGKPSFQLQIKLWDFRRYPPETIRLDFHLYIHQPGDRVIKIEFYADRGEPIQSVEDRAREIFTALNGVHHYQRADE